MKISTLKISISIIMMIFHSCIDSKDSFIESRQDFCYITSLDNTICAATSSGYITSTEIKKLTEKECYIMAYTITNPINGINLADNVKDISEGSIPQATLIENKPPKNSATVKDLSIPVFHSTSYFGDRWLFSYLPSTKEETSIAVQFFYDKNNQIDANGNKIVGENKIVIDVYFTKSDVEDSDIVKKDNILGVGNFEHLRTLFTPDYEKATTSQDRIKSVPVLIQFRYQKYMSENESPRESFLGAWSMNTNNRIFYMTFVQEK